jgi:hypothetical protein
MNLFSPAKEKFLVLDVGQEKVSSLSLCFDEHRHLVIEKIAEDIDLKKFLNAQARNIFQKSWEGKYFFNSHRRLMVSADSSFATTIPIPLDFKRHVDEENEPISLGELEDFLARAIARVFPRCRNEASRRLRIAEIDTILVGEKTDQVMVDGRPMADPLGHRGNKISLVLELTFTGRELFENLKPFFSSPEEFAFAEAPQASLEMLAGARGLPSSLVVGREDGKTSLFIFEETEGKCPVLYREPFHWESDGFVKRVAAEFGIDVDSAEEICSLFSAGAVSVVVAKKMNEIARPLAEQFFHDLDKANLHGTVFVDMQHALPFTLPVKCDHVTIAPVPIADIFKKFNFTSDDPAAMTPRVMLHYLAPFFELYFKKNHSKLNEKLRHRVHWLAE